MRRARFFAPTTVTIALILSTTTPASARGKAGLLRSPNGKGISAIAQIKYKKLDRVAKEKPASLPGSESAATGAQQLALSSTPPLSVCQTRTFPVSECAYYSLAPPDIDPTNKRRDRRRPSPAELAAALADRAIALAPEPDLSVAPSGIGLTGLPSYFWLAERPRSITATAGAGGVTVTAEARPIQFVWDYGDGVDKVTTHSGRQWTHRRSGNISHLYETKGRYDLRVEVVWEARWRIGSGAWQPLGYFSNFDERPYPVREIVAILVRAR